MPRRIRDFRAKYPNGWKKIAQECKIQAFLAQEPGKRIVADFFKTLKA